MVRVACEKRCTRCGKTKSIDEFHHNSSRMDGLQSHCKDCIRQYTGRNKRKYTSMEGGIKKCARCKQQKTAENFHLDNRTPDGLSSSCKECAWNIALKSKYGITEEGYKQILISQNNVCAICGNPETAKDASGRVKLLSIDHDHKTNKVRGLLCHKCNLILGQSKDNPDTLRKAANYLERNQ